MAISGDSTLRANASDAWSHDAEVALPQPVKTAAQSYWNVCADRFRWICGDEASAADAVSLGAFGPLPVALRRYPHRRLDTTPGPAPPATDASIIHPLTARRRRSDTPAIGISSKTGT
jgi:hypothetical protein